MLKLTREPRQTINIGDDVEVTVLEVNGNQVRLGIKAPKQVRVLREELHIKYQATLCAHVHYKV